MTLLTRVNILLGKGYQVTISYVTLPIIRCSTRFVYDARHNFSRNYYGGKFYIETETISRANLSVNNRGDMNAMDYFCVKCENTDVKKVAAVVREESWETKTRGESYGFRRDEKGRWRPDPRTYTESKIGTSKLAQQLAAPDEPCAILLSPDWFYALALIAAWFLTPSIGAFFVVWFISSGIYSQIRPSLKRAYRRHIEKVKEAKAAWERAMKIWNTLYYCVRCDTVYNPETGQSAPVGEMRTLL